MTQRNLSKADRTALRDAVALLQEATGADAIIIGVTRYRRRETETIVVPHGNAHACRGLVEYAYGQLCEDEFLEEDEVDNDGDESESE